MSEHRPSEQQCERHDPLALKTLTTDTGVVYVCERCSAHWFETYDMIRLKNALLKIPLQEKTP